MSCNSTWSDFVDCLILFCVWFNCLIEESLWLLYFCDVIFYVIGYLYREGLDCGVMFFRKLAFYAVPCVSGFIEFYYLFLFPDFEGVNGLC
jgi:hypothetical protein